MMDKDKKKKLATIVLVVLGLVLITLSCISIYNSNHKNVKLDNVTGCSIDNCPIPNTNKTCTSVIIKPLDGLYCNVDNIVE